MKRQALLILPIIFLSMYTVSAISLPSIKTPTILEVSPSSATINAGESITLVATLKDSTGAPISGKTISWSITQGNLSSSSCKTNEEGKCEVSFTAPEN